MGEAIPLAQGDLRWVFPEVDDPAVVSGALSEADARMRRVAAHLGAADTGLEFHRVEGFMLHGVFGLAESSDVSFAAELCLPQDCLWSKPAGPPWQVEAVVMVPGETTADDAEEGCGTEIVAEWAHSYDTPVEAARGLIQATDWLYEQCVTFEGWIRPPRRGSGRGGRGVHAGD